MDDIFKGSPFWQEIRTGLFVIQDYGWKEVLNAIPETLEPSEVVRSFQSVDQIMNAGYTGQAIIKGLPFSVKPNTELLSTYLPPDGTYNQECLFLQWMYHYYILEGVTSNLKDVPFGKWPQGVQVLIERTLHFMVYVAAIMCLLDDGVIKGAPTKEGIADLLPLVQFKIKKVTETLLSKTADYGESYRRHGVQGTITRIWDKIARYAQLSALGRAANYEPKADAIKDLLGYCTIAWSLTLDALFVEVEDEPVADKAPSEV